MNVKREMWMCALIDVARLVMFAFCLIVVIATTAYVEANR